MSEINSNLSVVSFNYERTFAYLFYKYKAASVDDTNTFYKNIRYIYGSFGELVELVELISSTESC